MERGGSNVAAVIPAKQSPGMCGAKCEQLLTNVYRVSLPRDVTVYRYDVTVIAALDTRGEREERQQTRQLVLSKNTLDDCTRTERLKSCMAAFHHVMGSDTFRDENKQLIPVFYNGKALLYSMGKELNIPKQQNRKFAMEPGGILPRPLGFVAVTVTINRSEEFELRLDALSAVSKDDLHFNASFEQFLSVASSHFVLHHPDAHCVMGTGLSYLISPGSYGFEPRDCPQLPEGKYVAVGSHKSAQIVEGSKGPGPGMALAVDTAKTAFHEWQYVKEKMLTIQPNLQTAFGEDAITKLNLIMKGLYIGVCDRPSDGPPEVVRVFKLDSLSARGARTQQFVYQGENITVEQYYRVRKEIILQFPDAPLLVQKRGTQSSYFPMELCVVMDNQRVSFSQQTPDQLKNMRDACIMRPAMRAQSNIKNFKSLEMNDEVFTKGGLAVNAIPMSVPARVLKCPALTSADSKNFEPFRPPRSWKFFKPASFPTWGVVLLLDGRRDDGSFQRFVEMYLDHGRQLGLSIPAPAGIENAAAVKLKETFDMADSYGLKFVLFVQNDGLLLQDRIKNFEREYEITTQNLKLSTVRNVMEKRQFQTLTNILAKTNAKLGGSNYYVATPNVALDNKYFSEGSRLFIGISLSRTPRGSTGPGGLPSFVLGYAANSVDNNMSFVGDFLFPTREHSRLVEITEELIPNTMYEAVKGAFETLHKSSSRREPDEVVIYMDGIPDSQYETMIKRNMHIAKVKQALFDVGFFGRMNFIAVYRNHNVRLVHGHYQTLASDSNGMARNVEPGTVVDTSIVSPVLGDFFLTSHKAFAGTAKVPHYVVLANDSGLSMDQLEELTYVLCFSHQIVTLSTSVPTPLYVAACYADRGRRLFKERFGIGEHDLTNVNSELSYRRTAFEGKRVNA